MLYIVFSYGRTEPLDLCSEIRVVGVEAVLLPPAFPLGFCQEGVASYGCRSRTPFRIFIPDRAALLAAVLAPVLWQGGDWDCFPKDFQLLRTNTRLTAKRHHNLVLHESGPQIFRFKHIHPEKKTINFKTWCCLLSVLVTPQKKKMV